MAPRISLALVIHNHQPVGNFGWVLEDVYRQAYEPLLAALERHPTVRLGLHYSGPLLEWLQAEHPEALERVAALVARDQVELLGGGYYEPILASLPERDRAAQLRLMTDELERHFGRRPRGAWLAERVWEPSLPADLGRAGYGWTVLDDNHLRAASVPEDEMWGPYTTDDQGHLLTIFGTEQGLRYRIPFGEVDGLIEYLRAHATEDGERLGMMGDDGEKFGAWPGTYEHCWGAGRWIERCFLALEASADWLATTTPSAWLARHAPVGRIYVPTASYVEMTEWALPAGEANEFSRLLHEARERDDPAARFLRGGFWRNFQARYREVNDLHKQMLRTSAAVEAMPPGPARAEAQRHLYRGQSNDCYWHGLFGGIYIVHMRMATLGELIAAEDLADTLARESAAAGAPSPDGPRLVDADLDGVDEVLVAAPGQVLLVDLAEGAGLGSWDLRASRVALASVIRRRPEAYHERLRAFEAAAEARAVAGSADGAAADAAPKTIHDLVQVREPGLAARLHYDDHERRSGIVRFLDAAAGPGELQAGPTPDLGDFAMGSFRLVSSGPARLVVQRDGVVRSPDGAARDVRVTRELEWGGGRSDPWLDVVVRAEATAGPPLDVELGLEWNVNLMGGGHNPAAYYELPGASTDPSPGTAAGRPTELAATARREPHDGCGDLPPGDGFAFGNEHEGVRVEATTTPPARRTWYPVESISNSEAGFERVYQGSCLLFRWPVRLAAGDEQVVRLRLAVSQARDRATEP
ncbi:MAG TPA: alpha-amylase/4-alpha-glucanotransferase domain-containing protein [Candidatus Limnocylindrales bacterium]